MQNASYIDRPSLPKTSLAPMLSTAIHHKGTDQGIAILFYKPIVNETAWGTLREPNGGKKLLNRAHKMLTEDLTAVVNQQFISFARRLPKKRAEGTGDRGVALLQDGASANSCCAY